MAKENGWGLGRIMGELKRLGLSISKGTVRNILLENNFDLGPSRGEGVVGRVHQNAQGGHCH